MRFYTGDYQEVHMALLPFFHCYGANAIMMIGFDLGAKLVTLPRFEAQTYLQAIAKNKVII